jgi:hypothetical protein
VTKQEATKKFLDTMREELAKLPDAVAVIGIAIEAKTRDDLQIRVMTSMPTDLAVETLEMAIEEINAGRYGFTARRI